jgi:importin-5
MMIAFIVFLIKPGPHSEIVKFNLNKMEGDLTRMLSTMMSTDNASRKEAEAYYNELLKSSSAATIDGLMSIFTSETDLVFRSFAGILIRRAIESYGSGLVPSQVSDMREKLIGMWTREKHHVMLLRLSHVMAQSSLKSPWDELIPKVMQCTASGMQGIVPALGLIEIISEYCPEDILSNLQLLGPFLSQFVVSQDTIVQIACAKAICACIVSLEEEEPRNYFKAALEPIVNVLAVALSAGNETDATKIISNLVTIAQEHPAFFKGSLDSVVSAMLTVANSQGLEFSTRSMALELLVTMTETAPALARRCPGLVQGIVPLAMSLMLEVEEEEEEWAAGPYTEEPSDENCSVGDEAIERISAGLGGKSIAEPILVQVQQFAAVGKDYRYRRAAVAALCRLAEGNPKFFKKYIAQSVQYLASSLQDSSSKVKFEGIQVRKIALFCFRNYGTRHLKNSFIFLKIILDDWSVCDSLS